jgi:hypothetical protein
MASTCRADKFTLADALSNTDKKARMTTSVMRAFFVLPRRKRET